MYYIILTIIVSLYLFFRFPVINVDGVSMYPTYRHGEFLIGKRLYNKKSLKVGQVVVFRSPENRLVIKRIAYVKVLKKDVLYYFIGDNRDYSHDSRSYGYVSSKKVFCILLNQRI